MNRPHLQDIFGAYFRSSSRRALTAIIGTFLIVELVLVGIEISRARPMIERWTFDTKPKIAQALFLENTLLVPGIIGRLPELENPFSRHRVTVTDLDGKKVYGAGITGEEGLQEGWRFLLFPPVQFYRVPLLFADRPQGSLLVRVDHSLIPPLGHSLTIILLLAFLGLMFRNLVRNTRQIVVRHVTEPLSVITGQMHNRAERLAPAAVNSGLRDRNAEVSVLFGMYDELVGQIEKSLKEEGERARLAGVAVVASQVAHDIRSPLCALQIVAGELKDAPAAVRSLAQRGIDRILEIVDSLSATSKATLELSPTPIGAEKITPELLAPIVGHLIEEKRLQFQGRKGLRIELCSDALVGSTVVDLPWGHFRRALSNLLNNAAESIPGDGYVKVELVCEADLVKVRVVDSGCGIRADVLPKLTQRGATFGKDTGSGLGLYHAAEVMRLVGGELSIESQEGVGTVVTLTLPRCAASPPWLAETLLIQRGSELVIVDDDHSIHDAWTYRLKSSDLLDGSPLIRHFCTAAEFSQWYGRADRNGHRTFLVDQHFEGESIDGLSLIEQFSLSEQALLVTGLSHDFVLRRRAQASGVRMLPKAMIPSVPISY